MRTLLYSNFSSLLFLFFLSCSANEHRGAQDIPAKLTDRCPKRATWSLLLQRCVFKERYDLVLAIQDPDIVPTLEIGVLFSKNRDKAELFLDNGRSVILEKNEQTMTFESSDQVYRLVRTQTVWVCTEVPNEAVAKSVSIYTSAY